MKNLQKILTVSVVVFAALWGQDAAACSPNLPNYGNCVRQQQEAHRQQQILGAMQQQQYGYDAARGRSRYDAPSEPVMSYDEYQKFMRETTQKVLKYQRENPEGCIPAEDGLHFCWSYNAISGVDFRYVLAGDCDHWTQCKRHGLQYQYRPNGSLQFVEIYDRDMINKGENTYYFTDDGVTVYNYKGRNSEKYTISKISKEEARERLNLPQSLLHLKSVPDPQKLAETRKILPSGCSGTARMPFFGSACSIKLLKR